jgi:hypothetical protein
VCDLISIPKVSCSINNLSSIQQLGKSKSKQARLVVVDLSHEDSVDVSNALCDVMQEVSIHSNLLFVVISDAFLHSSSAFAEAGLKFANKMAGKVIPHELKFESARPPNPEYAQQISFACHTCHISFDFCS